MVTRVELEDRIEYRNQSGELHREDGPAIEWNSGTKVWYLNGLLHREDGPAREFSNGTKVWWLNGNCHREDGPAYEGSDGDKWWYLNSESYSEQEYQQEVIRIKLERLKNYGN
jgi:hypothetical protein